VGEAAAGRTKLQFCGAIVGEDTGVQPIPGGNRGAIEGDSGIINCGAILGDGGIVMTGDGSLRLGLEISEEVLLRVDISDTAIPHVLFSGLKTGLGDGKPSITLDTTGIVAVLITTFAELCVCSLTKHASTGSVGVRTESCSFGRQTTLGILREST